MDFQTAPFEMLCGCVGIYIPDHMNHLFDKGPNLELTERLLRDGKGKRIVLANCEKCNGTGIDRLEESA